MKRHLLLIFAILCLSSLRAQQKNGVIKINTTKGHKINTGSSGFNVRIADKVWNYTHPDFKEAVHQLRPGWLRYFSGTMGDAFNSATGQYDLDYAMMFDKSKQYLIGHEFTEIKGPHRIADLYNLLGEINGKLIVTINAFSETPEITKELVRFIKNNHIKVEVWQFCNEPYFYVPHRERYWWNNGYDYAFKMKPHAEAILDVFPEAQIALNFTWDGIWGFMKEINSYQKEHGAYWNTFSKHSYAPHTGRKEPLEDAYRRGNTKIIEATSKAAMEEIEAYTETDIPMIITEFGVWNKPLNGIYSSIYNIEYVMRQLQHPNTKFVGAHEVSSKYSPKKDLNHLIRDAFDKGALLNTDSLRTGVQKNLEGKAYEIYHEATNNANYIYTTEVTNGFITPGMNNEITKGGFAQAYRGINGYDYLVVTNRSASEKEFSILVDGKELESTIKTTYITAENLEVQNTEIFEEILKTSKLNIRPFSVTVIKWENHKESIPPTPHIYNLGIIKNGVKVVWGPLENIENYILSYGEKGKPISNKIELRNKREHLIKNLKKDRSYGFSIKSKNAIGQSLSSDTLYTTISIPETPEIFKKSRRDSTATIIWRSVPNANGYILKYTSADGSESKIDVKNVFGYRLEGLSYDTPYEFSVAAYNGIGQSQFSKKTTITPKKGIPFSPRDVSAKETKSGSALIQWVEQEANPEGTTYIIMRGETLHKFEILAENISGASYEDKTIEKDKHYFYTVKAKTTSGESNFYPNIATLMAIDDDLSIDIMDITRLKNGNYKVTANYKNVLLDGEYSYGVILNNISYLNVEERKVMGQRMDKNKGFFEVVIPLNVLRKNARFAIKPFINTNGKDVYSNLPDKIIKVE